MERQYTDGKAHNKIVEALGREDRLREHHEDPESWARGYVDELNRTASAEPKHLTASWNPQEEIPFGRQVLFNGGYLFLQKIYNELSLPYACRKIQKEARAKYNLDSILSSLIYGRLLQPASKRATILHSSEKLLESRHLELHDVYRALSMLADKTDWLQAFLYRQSQKLVKRSDRILYYDVTNFYWETGEEDEFRKYGHSKENRPNPIVQMGLFMDASGLPLAFSLWPGNTSEQVTLKPLEEKIIENYGLEKFVTCTDAGLSSKGNRIFNTKGERAFVTTQSLKTMKRELQDWVFSPQGWHKDGDQSGRIWDLEGARNTGDRNAVFYKERWIKDGQFEQRLIVTFSRKYMEYQRRIREGQICRAQKLIEKNPSRLKTKGVNDCRRFIEKTAVTTEGEIASIQLYGLNDARIAEEEKYDGFYGVCTNLDDDISAIIRISKGRWEIEEAFRIMKNELEARPVFLSRQDRIEAHFLVCYVAFLILRLLERRLMDNGFRNFSLPEIVETLRSIQYGKTQDIYLPMFQRTALTQALSHSFGLPVHQEAYGRSQMRNLIAKTR